VQGYHPIHRRDVFNSLHAVDAGNIAFPPFDPNAMREAVAAEVGTVLAAGAVPFLAGGDHSIALPALRALAKKHGPVAVVHVDAHLDTSGPEVWGATHHHGTPFRHAIEEGLIERERLVQVGLRGPWGTAGDGDVSLAHGARHVTAEEVQARGMAAVAAEVRERVYGRPVYVSFDIDAVDPAFAPGTGTPVPGRAHLPRSAAAPAGPRGRPPRGHGPGGSLPHARPRRLDLAPRRTHALRGRRAGAARLTHWSAARGSSRNARRDAGACWRRSGTWKNWSSTASRA
jgi:hypothetical protein